MMTTSCILSGAASLPAECSLLVRLLKAASFPLLVLAAFQLTRLQQACSVLDDS